ncbi:MAG: hypothetical protein CNE98_00660 [Bacteroidetes bacterium MED-G17]|nr:MAG: hypothetical protein CBB99_05885 [Bacteroidetes bacterium TMED39]PDH53602.1 MAG: hypothetical protein CNE98_00660 [Bacteroidetes bacterium MED-G17]
MKNPAIGFLLCCLLAFLYACITRVNTGPTYYLSQEAKDYCAFQKGSWWVYQSNNGARDSSILLRCTRGERYFWRCTHFF